MAKEIPIEELDEDTRLRLGLPIASPPIGEVGDKLITLGKVLRVLKGLSDQDALSTLLTAERYIYEHSESTLGGYSTLVEEEPTTTYVPPMGWTIHIVAKSFSFKPADLKQRERSAEVALARQVAMYLLWSTEEYSLTQIGQALGGRTPATISHGFQRVAKQISRDPVLRNKVSEIQTVLSTGKEVTSARR